MHIAGNVYFIRRDSYRSGSVRMPGFKRLIVFNAEAGTCIVIYYGDDTIPERHPPKPHGNTTKGESGYIPTSKTVNARLLTYPRSMAPREVYAAENATREEGTVGNVSTQRNLTQFYNARAKERKREKDGTSVLEKLQLAKDQCDQNFIRASDVLGTSHFVIMTSDLAIKELREVTTRFPDDVVQLQYDTTYDVGGKDPLNKKDGFYGSTVTWAHPYLTRSRTSEEAGNCIVTWEITLIVACY